MSSGDPARPRQRRPDGPDALYGPAMGMGYGLCGFPGSGKGLIINVIHGRVSWFITPGFKHRALRPAHPTARLPRPITQPTMTDRMAMLEQPGAPWAAGRGYSSERIVGLCICMSVTAAAQQMLRDAASYLRLELATQLS